MARGAATLEEMLMTGGFQDGSTAAGAVDMSAATTGDYVYGYTGDKWHSKLSIHTYSWLIIAGALGILYAFGALVFKEVNV